jgi:hypothetical protein
VALPSVAQELTEYLRRQYPACRLPAVPIGERVAVMGQSPTSLCAASARGISDVAKAWKPKRLSVPVR